MNERLAVVVPFYNEPEINRTLKGLYFQSYRSAVTHYLIDNGSTDVSREIVEKFANDHKDFPLKIIEEGQKGTGAAVDTGFTAAIDDGCSWIARTDADTVPCRSWTSVITHGFTSNPDIRLIGGRTIALRDEDFRPGDNFLLPTSIFAARVVLSLRNLDPDFLNVVNGANMATTAQTYTEVGGFRRTSIDELDEDVEYSLAVIKRFGRSTVLKEPSAKVYTSMRRIREYGLTGTAMHHLFPATRNKREVDVR